jgi:hypothetical protein
MQWAQCQRASPDCIQLCYSRKINNDLPCSHSHNSLLELSVRLDNSKTSIIKLSMYFGTLRWCLLNNNTIKLHVLAKQIPRLKQINPHITVKDNYIPTPHAWQPGKRDLHNPFVQAWHERSATWILVNTPFISCLKVLPVIFCPLSRSKRGVCPLLHTMVNLLCSLTMRFLTCECFSCDFCCILFPLQIPTHFWLHDGSI